MGCCCACAYSRHDALGDAGVGVPGRGSAVVQDQRGEEHVLYFIQDTGRRLGNELTVRAREVERASPVRDAAFGGSDVAVDPCLRGSDGDVAGRRGGGPGRATLVGSCQVGHVSGQSCT